MPLIPVTDWYIDRTSNISAISRLLYLTSKESNVWLRQIGRSIELTTMPFSLAVRVNEETSKQDTWVFIARVNTIDRLETARTYILSNDTHYTHFPRRSLDRGRSISIYRYTCALDTGGVRVNLACVHFAPRWITPPDPAIGITIPSDSRGGSILSFPRDRRTENTTDERRPEMSDCWKETSNWE